MATMAAEQRRKDAWLVNSRRCSAALSSVPNLDLRFHRRLTFTAAPQRITIGIFCRRALRSLLQLATRDISMDEAMSDRTDRTAVQ
jgi:ribosomal protein L34E